MHIGDLELHLVSDGEVRSDAGGPFGLVPRALYQKYITPAADNTIPMALTSLLVRSRGKTILIDTGMGSKLSGKELARWQLTQHGNGLIDSLEQLGVTSEEVDVVINTHLHSDHCGGNTRFEGEDLVPSFPNAEYWVQRMEWADASHPDVRTRGTYLPENFASLIAEGRMKLLHGDASVTDQVRCVVTPGHTRGHQSVVLRSGEWFGLFVADMASYSAHMKHASWLTSYDAMPLENLATKQRWQTWAVEKRAWLFFEHDPVVRVGRLVRVGEKLDIEPVREAQEITSALPTPPPRA